MKCKTHAVTGAFGYSGRYIATRLLEQGRGSGFIAHAVGGDALGVDGVSLGCSVQECW